MHLLCLGDLHGEITLINRYYEDVTARFGLDIEAVLQCGDFGLYNDIGDFPAYIWGEAHPALHHLRRPWQPRVAARCPGDGAQSNHGPTSPPDWDAGDRALRPSLRRLRQRRPRHSDHGGGWRRERPAQQQRGNDPFDETVPQQHLAWWRQYRERFPECERQAPAGYWTDSPVMDILIAHEAPSGFGALGDPAYGDPFHCGSDALGELWRAVRPKIALSGHYHRAFSHRDPDGLRWEVLPMAKEGDTVLDTETWQLTAIGPPA